MANNPSPQVLQLLKELSDTKIKNGSIGIEDMTSILEKAVKGETTIETAPFALIKNEISAIANQLAQARGELSEMNSGDGSQDIAEASDHLGEVVKATEDATNQIMDSVERIQSHVAQKSDGWEEKIATEVSGIFEACNFQDLTGQRIAKVVKTLNFVEEKIERLQSLINNTGSKVITLEKKAPAAPQREDEALCNGPQLGAVSQDDIDALFSNG